MDLLELARNLISFFTILLFSLCFHEFAHAFVAKMRGDNTAEMMGRLTMNPFPHMDMTGTVMLPILTIVFNSMGAHLPLFGWAKPVPVNGRNLKSPKSDMFWIALAGPMSNVFLAICGALIWYFSFNSLAPTEYFPGVKAFLFQFVVTNLFLAIFNIIPLHPLDGGKVLARFLPEQINSKLEQNEHITSMLLLILIMAGALKILTIPVYWMFEQIMVLGPM